MLAASFLISPFAREAVTESKRGRRSPQDSRAPRRSGHPYRLTLLGEALLPFLALPPNPRKVVAYLVAISPHPKERQMLELVTITRADTFVRNRLNMHNDLRALGEIDWLVQDDATVVDFAAFCHGLEKSLAAAIVSNNLDS